MSQVITCINGAAYGRGPHRRRRHPVEEDGEFEILGCKDFSDPKKRSNLHSWVTKIMEKGGHAAQVHGMCVGVGLVFEKLMYPYEKRMK